ncbi:MAG TPA: 5,6-dimethylbenzimidazole synthase [Chlorobaculum sp.]|jgi:5,6-dimethylbenzimidazole synthase|uniref:5,6-dimethylbenzimidazole synthase n=1 Tax=Chlorobaculum tepidum (strain ATCC 49652 / DSM 12025 / NBRC 103806 / TLS) TaxID=194439 RepID=Q8KDV7_CHLTE|nr:5,6-dimethylbenzimidazole synthase [Chlorobaculum tepidum]AAM72172.1 nitroreductase family protein [Chlorobaculum tepidum TLS]HBU23100.1 5,6-dimethylbenzimidazole synthase [Chlorobaculum sp.]
MTITTSERNALYKVIYSRRDVRGQYLPDPVPEEVLRRVLDAAHHAPSVGFMQPWDFVVVHDLAVRKQIKEGFEVAHAEAAEMFEGEKREQYRTFKLEGILEAPVGICVTCDRSRSGEVVIGRTANPEMDLYSSVCAVQNLWLAARAENLGVGWVSIIHHDHVRRVLGIPEHIVPVAWLCIGYVSFFHEAPELEQAGWLPRLALDDLLHQEQW